MNSLSARTTREIALDILSRVRVAKPCPMRWGDLRGDDRVRHCEACDLNVYNLSAIAPEVAADLVTSREGRICGAMFRRSDGTLIVEDCPVGLERARRAARRGLARLAAGVAALVSLAAVFARERELGTRLAARQPFSSIQMWLRGPVAPIKAPAWPTPPMLGEISIAPAKGGST